MGGLDDLLPDDADTSGRSSSRSSTSSGPEYVKEFHTNSGKVKKFTEERWEDIKREIRDKSEYTVGEVESMEADKRHEVLHELAISSEHDKDPDELEHGSDVLCAACGADCSRSYTVIRGEEFCLHHPIAQAVKETDLRKEGKDHEARREHLQE